MMMYVLRDGQRQKPRIPRPPKSSSIGTPNLAGRPRMISAGFSIGSAIALPPDSGLRKPINNVPSAVADNPSIFSEPRTSVDFSAASKKRYFLSRLSATRSASNDR